MGRYNVPYQVEIQQIPVYLLNQLFYRTSRSIDYSQVGQLYIQFLQVNFLSYINNSQPLLKYYSIKSDRIVPDMAQQVQRRDIHEKITNNHRKLVPGAQGAPQLVDATASPGMPVMCSCVFNGSIGNDESGNIASPAFHSSAKLQPLKIFCLQTQLYPILEVTWAKAGSITVQKNPKPSLPVDLELVLLSLCPEHLGPLQITAFSLKIQTCLPNLA